jgi:integrase
MEMTVNRSEIVTLNFPDLKGGKAQADTLDSATSHALLTWLRNFYGHDLTGMQPETPLWVSLVHAGKYGDCYGQALSVRSFTDICARHFKTGKVHRTRHTWTKNMLDEGAPLPLIKKKLGHSSLATTGIYAESLEAAENPYAEKIARRAGIR